MIRDMAPILMGLLLGYAFHRTYGVRSVELARRHVLQGGFSIMSTHTLYRLNGGTLIAGSLLLLLASVIGAILFPGHSSTPTQVLGSTWPLVILMTLLGSLLFVISLPGMYLRQAGRAGIIGLIGFTLLFFDFLLQGAVFSSVQVVILPFLAQKAPQLMGGNSLPFSAFLILIVSGLMQIIGGILLGIATMRARVFPRWTGVLLLVSGIAFLLTIPPLPSPIGDSIEVVSFVTLAAAFIGCGYQLMAEKYETREAEVRSVAQVGAIR